MKKTSYEVWFDALNYDESTMKQFESLEEAKNYVKQLRREKRELIRNGKKCAIAIDLMSGTTPWDFEKTIYHKKYNF